MTTPDNNPSRAVSTPSGYRHQQVFKSVDDTVHNDGDRTSDLDYTGQSSWLLFLKHLDALEATRALVAKLSGIEHEHTLEAQYCSNTWAATRKTDGSHEPCIVATRTVVGAGWSDKEIEERPSYCFMSVGLSTGDVRAK